MTFTEQQLDELRAPLARDVVASRTQSGRTLSYIEAWHAIAEANRIFGFDAWDRELVEMRLVAERERTVGTGTGWGVSYIAKVRVRVGEIVREGCGAGHGIDRDLGLAHESASKEAESDAMKRAMMTFGNPFGLALYDKTQSNVADAPPEPPTKPAFPSGPYPNKSQLDGAITAFCGHIAALTNSDDLEAYVTESTPTLAQYRAHYGRDSEHVAAITKQLATARSRVAAHAELPADDAGPVPVDEPAHLWSESTLALVKQLGARETVKALEAWVNLPATKAIMATLDPVELQYVRGAYKDRTAAVNAMALVAA